MERKICRKQSLALFPINVFFSLLCALLPCPTHLIHEGTGRQLTPFEKNKLSLPSLDKIQHHALPVTTLPVSGR
ncbi:MAG: hypothetical protein J3R72DRAFT_455988 [Linnemannia gamsii]|nr:MAG: hypothetical protein J3R72DRAFT_455988 [Linnemannia gamsii]